MNKYLKCGLIMLLLIIIGLTTKVSITVSDNKAQADTVTDLTVEDADKYLESAIETRNSLDGSIRQAQIAEAIYAKKTYELLRDKELNK